MNTTEDVPVAQGHDDTSPVSAMQSGGVAVASAEVMNTTEDVPVTQDQDDTSLVSAMQSPGVELAGPGGPAAALSTIPPAPLPFRDQNMVDYYNAFQELSRPGYREILMMMCPETLLGVKCHHLRICCGAGHYFLCKDYRGPNNTTCHHNQFSHAGYVHTTTSCIKKTKVPNNVDCGKPDCRRLVRYVHVIPTCKDLLLKGVCNDRNCGWGHDMMAARQYTRMQEQQIAAQHVHMNDTLQTTRRA